MKRIIPAAIAAFFMSNANAWVWTDNTDTETLCDDRAYPLKPSGLDNIRPLKSNQEIAAAWEAQINECIAPTPSPTPIPAPTPVPTPSATPILDELYLSNLYNDASNRAKLEAVVGGLPDSLVQSTDVRVEALTDAQEVKFLDLSLLTLSNSPLPTSVTDIEVLGGKLLSDLEAAETPAPAPAPTPAPTPSPTPAPAPTPTPTPTPTPPPHHDMGNMPHVNSSLNAPNAQGSSTLDIKKATDTPDQNSGGGQFRIQCGFSHMLNDDPIVFPNQPGVSHHHTFFGNTSTNANSDVMNFDGVGNSTCHGGVANRSAYWNPSLIDTTNGRPLEPKWALFYYKTGNPAAVTVPPKGLRMIAGDAKATSSQWPDQWTKQPIRWLCNGDYNTVSPHIMSCGGELDMFIQFPECWDGVNLDSPNHKAHMAYSRNGGCPASHPVMIPTVTMNVHYDVSQIGTSNLRLASDNYVGGAGGYSLHGDWVNGWNEDVMSRIVSNCLKRGLDCHANLLGQGQELYNKFGRWDTNTTPEALK